MDALGTCSTAGGRSSLPLIALFMPFSVFWMRAHFLNLPTELLDSTRVDGAAPWQAFRHVFMPLAAPAWSSLAILLFLWTWNQFLLAVDAGRRPDEAHHGRCARRVPGPVRHRHRAALRRVPADHRADGRWSSSCSSARSSARSSRAPTDEASRSLGYRALLDVFAGRPRARPRLRGRARGAPSVVGDGGRSSTCGEARPIPARGRPWGPDTLALTFSCSKGLVATCVLMAAQDGRLELDAPVSDYWPAFGGSGQAGHHRADGARPHRPGLAALDDRPHPRGRARRADRRCGRSRRSGPLWEPGTGTPTTR